MFYISFIMAGIAMAIGTNWNAQTINAMNEAISPLREARSFFGGFVVIAFWIFCYNVYQTVIKGKGEPFEEGMDEVPDKYPSGERGGEEVA